MSPANAALERVTRVPGVRGSLLISATDGLVVAERLMDGIDGRAIAALTIGPAAVLASWPGVTASGSIRALAHPRGLVVGARADLVVFDRSERWRVTRESLASKGKNTPFLGRELPGRVLLTVSDGRLAYEDTAPS